MEDTSKPEPVGSAYESPAFDEDSSFHIDQPVGSMSISPCGRDVVLGSREGLYIIDLDSPYSPPRYLPHHTSWEVADVQWSPHAFRDSWVISTSNQKALVWNLAMPSSQNSIEFVLHGHTRAITDINFSAHDPHKLATCAVDSFVHCWDLRTPTRPVVSFSDWFAGATQVKWNRQDEHVIASSHDKFLHIWDDRKGAYPLRTIEAHSTKIYGIDWNRQDQNLIVTCSLDKSIKFWDYEEAEDLPYHVVETGFPVWRARHTPFGCGILAMPQRGNFDLHLYDRRPVKDLHLEELPIIARFPGHKAQVKEFLWRPRGTIVDEVDHREFQLVTWGVDRELRLHRMNSETMSAIGYERGRSKLLRLNVTRRGAKYKTFRDEPTPERVMNEPYPEHIPFAPIISPASTNASQFQQRRAPSIGMSKIGIPQTQGWVHSPGFGPRVGMHGRTSVRRDMNPITWMKNVKMSSWESETLGEEITQVGQKFAKVSFEAVDMQRRRSTISMQGPWAQDHSPMFMKIDIHFPRDYPRLTSPAFSIQKTGSMTDELSTGIQLDLQQIADAYVKRKRGCLEAALRYLLREQSAEDIINWVLKEPVETSGLMTSDRLEDDISSDEDDEAVGDFTGQQELNSSELLNANILVPVAKACGALWADNGRLVCFFPPKRNEPASFFDTLDLRDIDRSRSERVFERFGRFHTSSPGPKSALRAETTVGGDDEYDDDAESDVSDISSNSSSSSSGSSDILGSLPTGFLPPNAWRGSNFGLQRSRSTDQSQRSTNGKQTSNSNGQTPPNIISIHNLDDILPGSRELAVGYRLFGESSVCCIHNSSVAEKVGTLQVAQAWKALALILQENAAINPHNSSSLEQSTPFKAASPLHRLRRHDSGVDLASTTEHGISENTCLQVQEPIQWGVTPITSKALIPDIFQYFERLGDIQMLAMLSCMLHRPQSFGLQGKTLSNLNSLSGDPNILGLTMRDHYHPDKAKAIPSPWLNHSSMIIKPQARKASAAVLTATNSTASSAERTGASLIPAMLSTEGSPPVRDRSQEGPMPTPHLRSRLGSRVSLDNRDRDRLLKSHPQSMSLSSSPSDNRLGQHFSSNAAFSFSRASFSNLVQTYSHSPPGNSGSNAALKKQSSPSNSFTGSGWIADAASQGHDFGSGDVNKSVLQPSNTPHRSEQQASPSFSKLPKFEDQPTISKSYPNANEIGHWFSGTTNTPRNTISLGRNPQAAIPSIPNDGISANRKSFQVHMALHNLEKLDHGDGASYFSKPLLDPNLEWKYRAYRAQYANLLGVWGLDVHRRNILAFDGSDSNQFGSEDSEELHRKADETAVLKSSHSHLRSTFSKSQAQKPRIPGLGLQKHCLQCGDPLSPVLKNGSVIGWASCVKCPYSGQGRVSAKRAMCSICQRAIQGLSIPCLNCGHASCLDCTVAWFGGGTEPVGDMEKECPTACGCICPQHRTVQPPWPESAAIAYSLPQVGVSTPTAASAAPVTEPAIERLQRVSLVRSKSNLGSMAAARKSARSRSRSHTARSIPGPVDDRGDDDNDEDEEGLELGAGFGPAAPEAPRFWATDLHERASFSRLRGA